VPVKRTQCEKLSDTSHASFLSVVLSVVNKYIIFSWLLGIEKTEFFSEAAPYMAFCVADKGSPNTLLQKLRTILSIEQKFLRPHISLLIPVLVEPMM